MKRAIAMWLAGLASAAVLLLTGQAWTSSEPTHCPNDFASWECR